MRKSVKLLVLVGTAMLILVLVIGIAIPALADDDNPASKTADEEAAEKLEGLFPKEPGTPGEDASSETIIEVKGVTGILQIFLAWTFWFIASILVVLIIWRAMLVIFGGPEKAEMAKASMKNLFIGYAVITGISIVIYISLWIFTGQSPADPLDWSRTLLPMIPPM
jgi:hypothetical protein